MKDLQDHARRLLVALRNRAEPVVVTELAPCLGMSPADVEAAWRYLRDQRWIETFNVRYAARINARGIDELTANLHPRQLAAVNEDHAANLATALMAAAGADPVDRGGIPELANTPQLVLHQLWADMLENGMLLDAPSYGEAHGDWRTALAKLDVDRCIQRDGDQLRLTPLGLLCLREDSADAVVRIGGRVRRLLAEQYRDTTTRYKPVLVSEVAQRLGICHSALAFALFHLSDAVGRWCSTYTTNFAAAMAVLQPAERVLHGLSVGDVAREMNHWAETLRRNAGSAPPLATGLSPAVDGAHIPAPAVAVSAESVYERWIKSFKNSRLGAVLLIIVAVLAGLSAAVKNGHDVWTLFRADQPATTVSAVAASAIDRQLQEDMKLPVDLCLTHEKGKPVVQCVTHGVCARTGAQGLGFAIDKSSKAAAAASCLQACRAEADQRRIRCVSS